MLTTPYVVVVKVSLPLWATAAAAAAAAETDEPGTSTCIELLLLLHRTLNTKKHLSGLQLGQLLLLLSRPASSRHCRRFSSTDDRRSLKRIKRLSVFYGRRERGIKETAAAVASRRRLILVIKSSANRAQHTLNSLGVATKMASLSE